MLGEGVEREAREREIHRDREKETEGTKGLGGERNQDTYRKVRRRSRIHEH
jgi:hypothetical protein